MQGVSKKIMSFHKLISKRIKVQSSSHYDGMFLNRSTLTFNVLCFYPYRYRDVLHWKRKGVMCAGVFSITVEQDCATYTCEGVLKAVTNSNADFDMAQNIQRERLFVQEKKIWTAKKLQIRRWSVFIKKSCKAQRNRYEEQVWKFRFHQQQFGTS